MPRNDVSHDAVVADWTENAEAHDDDNYRFLRSLKQRAPTRVDRIARELHKEAFRIVDCTKCANCCRTMQPTLSDQDIKRIGAHLGLTKADLISAYLKWDEEEGAYRTATAPCPFLGEDSRCTIYDVRPKNCQGYPFTDKADFSARSINHANNAVVCPAVFYVVEQMKRCFRH